MSRVQRIRESQDSPPKPDWIRVRVPAGQTFEETRSHMRRLKLNTVCEEAACPNMGECWDKRHATVMILGAVCTRACAFCNVQTGPGQSVDPQEPEHVAEAAKALGLAHMVITSVDRDDLVDGGAGQFAASINALRAASPATTIEVLTPDFKGKDGALEMVVAAGPDVYNHNLETVPRLYGEVRPGADYHHSLGLLGRAKVLEEALFTKSGLMVGLGETFDEVLSVMDDLRASGVDFLTIGQYLRPTMKHIAVHDYIHPSVFEDYAGAARDKGFLMVSSSPLTRSSYFAGDDFKKLKAARDDRANRAN